MSKLSLSDLNSFVAQYVKAATQAGTWTKTTDNLYGLIDKIGKQVFLPQTVADKLPMLDGDELPYGKTIEESMIDFTMVQRYADLSAGDALSDHSPTVEEAAYCTTIGKYVIPTTVPYDNVERAALGATEAANMITNITERLSQSYTLYKYQLKKQLLGQMATKAYAISNCKEVVATPVDCTTGEAFIKAIKNDVEEASFANENHNLGQCLIGAAEGLTLFIKKGVMSSIEVDTLAGAFNQDKLSMGVNVVVVDDFGDADSKIWAILADPRGIKLHQGYHAVRSQENAAKNYVNFFDHSEHTGFISKFTYVKVFATA